MTAGCKTQIEIASSYGIGARAFVNLFSNLSFSIAAYGKKRGLTNLANYLNYNYNLINRSTLGLSTEICTSKTGFLSTFLEQAI